MNNPARRGRAHLTDRAGDGRSPYAGEGKWSSCGAAAKSFAKPTRGRFWQYSVHILALWRCGWVGWLGKSRAGLMPLIPV